MSTAKRVTIVFAFTAGAIGFIGLILMSILVPLAMMNDWYTEGMNQTIHFIAEVGTTSLIIAGILAFFNLVLDLIPR